MQKKIGIITFHYKNNFGAVLQCYALQEFLKRQGYLVEIINLKPTDRNRLIRTLKQFFKYLIKSFRIKNLFVHLSQFFNLFYQSHKFCSFRKTYLNISKFYNISLQNHDLNEYDCIITGSDQVWNSIKSYSNTYFLIPFEKYKGLRLSYAACRGVRTFEIKDKEIYAKALKKYHWIGVRDIHTQNFTKKFKNINSEIVCDPSMLHDYSEINFSKTYKFKYIFVYILGKEINCGHKKIIELIKKEYGNLKVVACYLTEKNPNYFSWADINIYDASPTEWVNFIRNSSYFYTDSFHGVLFSMKFNIPFLGYYSEDNRSSRLLDLAKRFNIEKYIVSGFEEIQKKQSISKGENPNKPNINFINFKSQSENVFKSILNKYLT